VAVEIVEGDMARPETLIPALRGVERAMLISSSDPMMLDVQSNFIACRPQGPRVKHVVKLSGFQCRSSILHFGLPGCMRESSAGWSHRNGIHALRRRRIHAKLLPAGASIIAMHPGKPKWRIELRHDAGQLDDMLYPGLAGGGDEIRLHVEHHWV